MPAIPSLTLHRRWIFLAFLLALHLVFLQGPTTALGRLLFLSHIGLGLLWQPFVQPRRRVGFVGSIVVVVCAGLFAYSLGWGLLTIWAMLLTGVVGGKVFLFPDRFERLFHLMALGYLVTCVLALSLPQALTDANLSGPLLANLVRYLLPVVFLVMAVLPAGKGGAERAEIVDYVYGVFVFLLLAVIVLGSLSFSLLFKVEYFEALLMTLALVAGTLFLLGWIWNPSSDFGGLGSAVAQHVMSLGLPIEDWLESLADLSRREDAPERFLVAACAELPQRLPGVAGGNWADLTGPPHNFGVQEGRYVRFSYGHLKLGLWSRVEPTPSLLWHYDLAARLLAEFHMGKWRAQELQRLSYVEAIHETGARLTHDVKNLLQSLETLCVAAREEEVAPSVRFTALMQRQLPEISSRLRQTLIKLSSPDAPEKNEPVPALTWFSALKSRYENSWTVFSVDGDLAATELSEPSLFSGVAENLLQNLADKRSVHPDLLARVRLGQSAGEPWLEVEDDGLAVPADLATTEFRYPVASKNGLGVGLYQCARLAREAGYRLELNENRPGCVRFRLAPAGQGQDA